MYSPKEIVLVHYYDGNSHYAAELIEPYNGAEFVMACNINDGDPSLKKYHGYVPGLALHRTIVGHFAKPTYEFVIMAGKFFISSQKMRHRNMLQSIVNYMTKHSPYCCLKKSELNGFFSTYNPD